MLMSGGDGLKLLWCTLSDIPPDGDDEGSLDHSMGTSSTPIPKIVTTPIQEAEDDSRNEWGKIRQGWVILG
jgi:hypothetical protein